MLFNSDKIAVIDAAANKEISLVTLNNLTVTTTSGNTFDANLEAITNMLSAIQASSVLNITEHNWKLADNSIVLIPLSELEEAHALAIQAKAAIVLGN